MERSLNEKTNETLSEKVIDILKLVGAELNGEPRMSDFQTQLFIEYVESETGVRIPLGNSTNFTTLQDYITYITDHSNQQTY